MRGLHAALEAEELSKNPRNLLKHTIAVWNMCHRRVPNWPDRHLSSPFKTEPYMLPLEAFPQSFQEDVAAFEARMSNPDPRDKDSPVRAIRPITLEKYRYTFRRVASALVRTGRVYAAQGRADAALRQFQALEVLLEAELGVGPERETLELARDIRARRHSRGAPPPVSGSPAVTSARAETEAAKTAATLGAPSSAERLLPDKPSIAVLPFVNMSGDPEQEFFADGLTEDIITALSHYRWFFVIARNSSFAYKGRALDVKQIARDLGVRYVVEGSVRKAGGRVRVTGQLIDAETGAHLWVERYDRDLSDIFAIQDELTQRVVGAIEPEVLMGEGRRAVRRPTENLDAYECHMRGMWHHAQGTAEDLTEAIRWYRQAIALDSSFGRAHMLLARSVWATCHYGYSGDIARRYRALLGGDLSLRRRRPPCPPHRWTAQGGALRTSVSTVVWADLINFRRLIPPARTSEVGQLHALPASANRVGHRVVN